MSEKYEILNQIRKDNGILEAEILSDEMKKRILEIEMERLKELIPVINEGINKAFKEEQVAVIIQDRTENNKTNNMTPMPTLTLLTESGKLVGEEIYDEEENIILYEIIFFIKVDNSVAMFSQDNTKFEQLKRQEEKLYYTNKEGLLTLNSDFKLLRVNDAFFKILTYTREEFKSVGQFDNSKDYIEALSSLNLNANKIFEEYLEIINHNKFFSELEMSFIDKNGKNKYLRIYITPTIYNGEFAIQSSIRDITEIKEKEDRALHLDETLFSFENLTTAALSYE